MALSSRKPIDLYSIGSFLKTIWNLLSTNSKPAFPNSPNPWKVAIILEELGLEYNIILLDFFSVKKAPYTDLNPNGRTPAIVDHNNDGFVLWEIILYTTSQSSGYW
jgi:hypothetical protein